MKTRHAGAIGIVIAAYGTAIAAIVAHDWQKTLNNLHPRYIQMCVMGTDEDEMDCEKRWQNALK